MCCSFLKLTVKTALKFVNVSRSYRQNYVGYVFYGSRCICLQLPSPLQYVTAVSPVYDIILVHVLNDRGTRYEHGTNLQVVKDVQ